jgi:YD repeat-containing protein
MAVREQRWERGDSTKYHDSELGRLSRLEDYSPEGRLTSSVDYTYDDHGNNIERVVRDGSGKFIRRLQFEFDVQA